MTTQDVAANSAADPSFIVTRYPTAMPSGPALGDMQRMTWSGFTGTLLAQRRVGDKDGANIVYARFRLEPNGQARRLKENVLGRTGIALDCERNKDTGEIPPDTSVVADRLTARGWAGALYTSHNHHPDAPRYRIVLPLTAEIAPTLPAVEVIADMLGLAGVLDRSKLGASSVFYLPSTPPGRMELHQTVTIEGAPVDAAWMQARAGEIMEAREREQAALRAEVMREAEKRANARAKAAEANGTKPTDKLIEAIRDRLDLIGELTRHGYGKIGDRYIYPESESGIPGVHVMTGSDGVARVYSHHAADPLAADNLPSWCTVKAIDVVDLVTILDFGGDRKKALHTLATRFGIGEPLQAKVAPEEPDGFFDVPPGDDAECRVKQGVNEHPILPPRFSDDALASTFSARHDGEILYVPAWSAWLRWSGAKWAKDDVLAVYDAARVICREVAADAAQQKGGDAIAKAITSAGTVSAVERLARSDRRHARAADAFDADPWLLNTPGGVINLRTGIMRPHAATDMLTKVAGCAPGGSCRKWVRFLLQITQGNRALVRYLQRFIGYTLTGTISEHAFLFAYGPGGNGKGVLFTIVAEILGDYATTAMHDVFMVARNDQHTTNLAALRGARMVAVTETEEGRQWAEARVKAITGGDKISARVMRGDPFEFTPVCKLWFSGNHKPPLRNPDAAMRRRMNLVPLTFVPSKPDTGLVDTLRAELPGIMAWAVQGCLEWQRMGLKPPACVTTATDEYFATQDSLAEWLDIQCERKAGVWTTVRTLFTDWKAWSLERGEEPGTEKRFSEAMQKHAVKEKKPAGMAFIDVRLFASSMCPR